MSAGAFIRSRYQSNRTGQIHPIRIQPETLTLTVAGTANSAPGGATNTPISAAVSRSQRSLGLNARMVTIVFPTGAPTGYKAGSPISLPWLTPGDFDDFVRGDAVSYLDATGELVGITPETAN